MGDLGAERGGRTSRSAAIELGVGEAGPDAIGPAATALPAGTPGISRAEIDLLVSDPDTSSLRRMRWSKWAACGDDEDPDSFFPEPDSPDAPQIAEVLARCRQHCPVVRVCAAWATVENLKVGIVGGMFLVDESAKRIELQLDLLAQIAVGAVTPEDAQTKAGPIKRRCRSGEPVRSNTVIWVRRTPEIEAIIAEGTRLATQLRAAPKRVIVIHLGSRHAGTPAVDEYPFTPTELGVR